MIRWLLTAFFTSILLSCSVVCYMATYILRTCLSICLYLCWPHTFATKINRIYKQKFSDVSKGTSPILSPRTWSSDILNRRGKNLHQFVQKIGKNKKKKNNRCCKALCVNIQTQKFTKIFKSTCILITFIQPKHVLNWF